MNELFPHGRILFSSPEAAYDVCYRINDWMRPDKDKVNHNLAIQQWNELLNTVIRLGVKAEIISIPHPDGVFSANAGLVYGNKFILSSFKHPERQSEEHHWMQWARSIHHPENPFKKYFESIHVISSEPFEGAGDALFVDDNTLVCGWGFRTSYEATRILANLLPDVQVIPVQLKNPKFYHLDTCFCPLGEDKVMFNPEAFVDPDEIRKAFDCIEVSQADCANFACNAVVIGYNVILPSKCNHTMTLLRNAGFKTYSVDMSEFLKSGGACKCLTLKYM